MNSIQNNANERGSAILMVLGLLSLLLVMALIFAVTSRNAQIVADANADQTQAKLVSQSALTRATDALFFFQNKGNLLQSDDLEKSMPESDMNMSDMLDQSPHRTGENLGNTDPKADMFYGTAGTVDNDDPIQGLQPYVGYVDATNEWDGLALYGEFNQDDFASVPFELVTKSMGATKNPYQAIYYSHEDDSYDEEGEKSSFSNFEYKIRKENSLFDIISKTRLGKAYRAASSSDPDNAEEKIEDGTSDDQFAKLLNDKDNLSKQLQFREEKDSDGHVSQRLGFVAFVDGPKFDLNQIVASKMDGDAGEPYVPWIFSEFRDSWAVWYKPVTGDPGKSTFLDGSSNASMMYADSAFAVMGYKYSGTTGRPSELVNNLVEEETVQYGLHPQELRTREKNGEAVYAKDSVLKRKDKDVPPKWFSYDQLLPSDDDNPSQELKDVKSAFLKDIYTLSLASGTEDREYRFNGRYTSFEQMKEIAESEVDQQRGGGQGETRKYFLRKIDLAWPKADYFPKELHLWQDHNYYCGGDVRNTWDEWAKELYTRRGTSYYTFTYNEFFEAFCRQCLGLHYDVSDSNRYLFKGSAGEDLTQEVLANVIDACDSNNDVSYHWDVNIESSIGASDTISEPSFCGNEMGVPAVMGVNVTVGMDSTKDKLSSTVTTRQFEKSSRGGGGWGGGGTQYVSIPTFSFDVDGSRSTISAYYNPKVTLNLQNLLNEDQLSSHKKFRVILKGKIASALKVKQVTMQYDATGMGGGGNPPWSGGRGGASLDNSDSSTSVASVGDGSGENASVMAASLATATTDAAISTADAGDHQTRQAGPGGPDGPGGPGGPGGRNNGQWIAKVTNGLTGFSTTYDFVECADTAVSLYPETLGTNQYLYGANGLAGTSSNYGVTPGAEDSTVVQALLNTAEEFTFDQTINLSGTDVEDLNALEYKTIELDMGNFSFYSRKLPTKNNGYSPYRYTTGSTPVFYYPTGTVLAVRLDEIVIMAQDDVGDKKMSDIVYADAPADSWSIAEGGLDNEGFQELNSKPFDDFFTSVPVNGMLCKDPRMNHRSKAWKWLSDNDDPDSTVLADLITNSGTKVDRQSHNVTGLGTYNFTVTKNDYKAWCDDEFVSKGCWQLMEDNLRNADPAVEKDWEPDFTPTTGSTADHKMGAVLSTAVRLNAPFTSLWQVGSIFRGEIGRTLNLKKFGTEDDEDSPDYGVITHLYKDGDAWLLDYVNLTTMGPEWGIRGKFNPNCFNKGSYRYLFANIPANEDAGESWIYRPGDYSYPDDVTRNTYFRDFVGGEAHGSYVDLEDKVFRFRDENISEDDGEGRTASQNARHHQSWSPIQSFFNFIDVDGATSSERSNPATVVQCNDRMAESLIGCTAGLLSTRYETYTVIAVGQSVKWLEDMKTPLENLSGEARDAFLKQLTNPIQLKDGEWYSILSTQVRLVTLVRDCWFGTFKVAKTQLLYP